MPQLDSLRAFAVLGVLIFHYRPAWTGGLPLGYLGVQLFFVLSGYLITMLLLRARRVEMAAVGAGITLRTFFVDRALRIFPLYYATLFALWLCGSPELHTEPWWHIFYASNARIAELGYYPIHVAHFWTLAVEQQFYLIWPVVVLFTPEKRLLTALLAIAAIGPLYRLSGVLAGADVTSDWLGYFVATPGNIDGLALGGILAATSTPDIGTGARAGLMQAAAWVGAPLAGVFLLRIFVPMGHLGHVATTLANCAWGLVFVWLLARAAPGFGGTVGWLLERPFLRYLGRISYGIYVFHPLVPSAIAWAATRLHLTLAQGSLLEFVVWTGATMALAALSWKFYEKPLNDLKVRFSSIPRPVSGMGPVSATPYTTAADGSSKPRLA